MMMNRQFEDMVRADLHSYLVTQGETSEVMPETADIEGKWQQIAEAYLPDGIREFGGYPVVSLGWMMYMGMAIAALWDADWATYSQVTDLYQQIRDKRGFDNMDEYIRLDVLRLTDEAYDQTEQMVQQCASRTYGMLKRQQIEPGTPEAFRAYVACLHQLYIMGAAVQLNRMGYVMEKISNV